MLTVACHDECDSTEYQNDLRSDIYFTTGEHKTAFHYVSNSIPSNEESDFFRGFNRTHELHLVPLAPKTGAETDQISDEIEEPAFK